MGTRGFRVIRWRGYYLSIYNHYDSYPSGLGLEILQSIPTDPARYQEWLEAQRNYMDQRIEGTEDFEDDENSQVSRTEPQNDIFIAWMYELDLDHEVFLVDGEPLFALNRVPPADDFEEYIGANAYRHRSYDHDTPEEYRYSWKVPPRPVDPFIIAKYEALVTGAPTMDIHTLLGTQGPGAVYNLRCAFYQTLIRIFMLDYITYHYIIRFDTLQDESEIPLDLAHFGVTMLALGLFPMIIEGGYRTKKAVKPMPTIGLYDLMEGYVWIIEDVCCVRMCTHLDDEASAKAAIVALIEHIKATVGILEPGATVYGILYSFSHCLIVRVQMTSAGKTSCTHSPALQFLPSWYSSDMSTPGICAIAHLGCLLTPIVLSNHFSIAEDPPPLCNANPPVVTTVPGEIWHIIAPQMRFFDDLSTLASISPTARAAAIDALSYPHIDGATLLSVGPVSVSDDIVFEPFKFNIVYEPLSDPKPKYPPSSTYDFRPSIGYYKGDNRYRSYTHEVEGILTFKTAESEASGICVYDADSIWAELEGQKPRGFREHMAFRLMNLFIDYKRT